MIFVFIFWKLTFSFAGSGNHSPTTPGGLSSLSPTPSAVTSVSPCFADCPLMRWYWPILWPLNGHHLIPLNRVLIFVAVSISSSDWLKVIMLTSDWLKVILMTSDWLIMSRCPVATPWARGSCRWPGPGDSPPRPLQVRHGYWEAWETMWRPLALTLPTFLTYLPPS